MIKPCLYEYFYSDGKKLRKRKYRYESYIVVSWSFSTSNFRIFKVHIFWEGHKISTLDVVPVISMVETSQNFVAFSKYMNFTWTIQFEGQMFFLLSSPTLSVDDWNSFAYYCYRQHTWSFYKSLLSFAFSFITGCAIISYGTVVRDFESEAKTR